MSGPGAGRRKRALLSWGERRPWGSAGAGGRCRVRERVAAPRQVGVAVPARPARPLVAGSGASRRSRAPAAGELAKRRLRRGGASWSRPAPVCCRLSPLRRGLALPPLAALISERGAGGVCVSSPQPIPQLLMTCLN